ncbi:MAG: reverse transcriptase [Altibacter sp.]|uniref:reverse transcriptase family protein n=1 Tax=Altibacter sp. TaxID=2024823 RepID=UPI000C8C4678|nr:reverse transcriptase family protein [Altibacter sp.]MAP55129.1 reverse transcriptase [Altibacter sp.]
MEKAFDKYKKQFVTKARKNGFSEDNINKCLDYSKPLITKDLPVIYNTTHLSQLVGYNLIYLRRAARFTKYFYRSFKVLKNDKTYRTISEPLPSLKEIQIWILKEILYKNKVSKYAKGYVPKRSIKDHVRYHTKESKVLTLDIKNFFDSIKIDYTLKMFIQMGYSKSVSNLLTQLCYLEKGLPQGAPTSPYITNVLLYEFDESIAKYCRQKELKYTRYADDLAFSGQIKKTELIKLVRSELRKIGLKLNNDKIILMKRNQRQTISGIVVNDKTQVPKYKRNSIRNEMFYIKKFGLNNHQKRTNQTRDNYLKHLIGKINYILMLNPKDKEFLDYKKYLYEQNKASR